MNIICGVNWLDHDSAIIVYDLYQNAIYVLVMHRERWRAKS